MKSLDVVAAIISNSQGKILFAQKLATAKNNPLLWEFPGGKVESGESFETALVREIHEELNLNIYIEKPFMTHSFVSESSTINPLTSLPIDHSSKQMIHLHVYLVKSATNDFQLNDHQQCLWLKKEKAQELNFAPADIAIFQKLLITNWP